MKTLPSSVLNADPYSLAINERIPFTRRVANLPDKQRMRDAKIVAQLIKAGDEEEDYAKVIDIFKRKYKLLSNPCYWDTLRTIWVLCGSTETSDMFRPFFRLKRPCRSWFMTPEDAAELHHYLGRDPEFSRYSGWNPYATLEMAQETVRRFIEGYGEEHFYSWIMDVDDVVVGTVGAYDYQDGRIEVGVSVVKGWQGRGLATEALKAVLEYLTDNEGIGCVTAWCASENAASRRVLEKAGMRRVRTEVDGLKVGDRTYCRSPRRPRP